MNKTTYLNTAIASVLAFLLLLLMTFTWPDTGYGLYDVIMQSVDLSQTEKEHFIKQIGINYALDTVFIFSWIGAWVGLFLHFKHIKVKLINLCFALSLMGALLDITENSISFSLLIGHYNSPEKFLFLHSMITDISYWLPMIASFILVIVIPKEKGIPNALLKITGSIGVLFAILGMYIPQLSFFPYYWFCLWFLTSAIVLGYHYKALTLK